MTGSGDFSIGSKIWPGTSKLLEEMGELQQVLGKLIAVHGRAAAHWDGDLRPRLTEELADVTAALVFFITKNFTSDERDACDKRFKDKLALFHAWHEEHTKPDDAFLEALERSLRPPGEPE